MRLYTILVLILCLLPGSASAHAVSNSQLQLTISPERISGAWRIALRDLDGAIDLDSNADGSVAEAEVSERSEAISSYLLARLELETRSGLCPFTASAPSLRGAYVVLDVSSDCEGGPLSLRYDLFFDHDAAHQGHLQVTGATELTHVFTSQSRKLTFDAAARGWSQSLGALRQSALIQYLGQGIWHILIGADHILFLLTLLVASVLRFESGRYGPVASFRSALVSMAKIVTAFTAAHSITLTSMALGVVVLPSRWVETVIALSIVAAAANNLWPRVTRRTWLLAFVFGLVHGLGFGGVLLELGLPEDRLFTALLGFNLGVELGQLAIVTALFPLAFWLRTRASYQRYALGLGSALIGGVGLVWSLERALDAEWTASLWSSAGAALQANRGAERARPCAGLPALREPALYDAALSAEAKDAASLAQRRAVELACRGELDAAARSYAEALAAADAATPPRALAWMLRGYAEIEQARGASEHAEELLARSIESWRVEGAEAELAAALVRLGELMAQQARWADAYLHYDEARRLHKAAGATALLAVDLSRLGDALLSSADAKGAKGFYEQARAAFEQVKDFAGVATQYRNLAVVARLTDDTALAAQMYRRAIELHERQGHQPEAASDMAALARVYLGTQQYAEAEALYERAIVIERQLGRERFIAKNYNQLGNLHQLQGELGPAEQMYLEALRSSERAGDDAEAANNCANLAGVYQKTRRMEQARDMYERSLSLFERSGAETKVLRVRGLLASLDRAEGSE